MLSLLTLLVPLTATYASFPTATDFLLADLSACSPAAQSDVDCLNAAKSGLQKVQAFMQQVHDARSRLEALSSAMATAKSVLLVVDFIPAIGTASKALEQTLNLAKPAVDSAYGKAKAIDDKFWPYKPKVDSLLTAVSKATSALTILKQKCSDGATYSSKARDCVLAMPEGSAKTSLGGAAEAFAANIQPPTHAAVQAMSTLGTTCGSIRAFVSLPWPDIGFINSALASIQSKLNPIISALQNVKRVLSQTVCLSIPSPAELASEAKEKLNPTKWFGKRKRGFRRSVEAEFALVSTSRQDSHRLLKRDWCVSVQDFLNGVNGVQSAVLGQLQDMLNKALSDVPSLTLPGLPDFSKLLNFNFNINFPSLDLGLDFKVLDQFSYLNFQCVTDISASCSDGVALSSSSENTCSLSLAQYKPTTTRTPATSTSFILPVFKLPWRL